MSTRIANKLVILGASLGLCVIAGAVFTAHHQQPVSPIIQPRPVGAQLSGQANPASPQTVHYAADANGRALQRGVTYLVRRVGDIPPYERLILDYLQRHYGLPPVLSAARTPIQTPTANQSEDAAEFLAFRRFSYPKSLVSKLPPNSDDAMSTMLLAAANCDHIPLPADFDALVQQNITAGRYNLTHVEFSLQRLAENNCQYFSPARLADIQSQVADGLVQLASASDSSPDLRYEATAFLLDMGGEDRVQPAWISQMVAEQRPDGGWRRDADVGPGSDHTAILAVWTLLIWTQQPATNQPMIVRLPTAATN